MNFRRWITAMAALCLFTGIAAAQGNLTCAANVSVPPQLRGEGMTELIGDIVLTCSGGVAGNANFTVSLGTNVTSRLLGTGGASNSSEALLLIDDPGPGSQVVCGSANLGASPGGCTVPAPGTPGAPNVFQGLVSANQVTFLGVPIVPPATAGASRVYRITDVRANVSALGSGGLPGTTQLLASVAISGSQSILVSNPVLVAGFIQNGLSTSIRNFTNLNDSQGSANLAQCGGSNSPQALRGLRFSENFATAFKTRVQGVGSAGQAGGLAQPQPGTIYNSESGLTIQIGSAIAGLADYGTRLKAVFNNVPAGVRLFVSLTNVGNSGAPVVPFSDNFAQLLISETAPDANGFPPLASATTTVGGNPVWEVPIVSGTGTAVWEVITTNPFQFNTLDFGVYQQFSFNPGAGTPPVGTATVNLSYAPTPPVAFSASAGGMASGTLTIPRFADTSTASNLFSIVLCRTTLLYPFVTNLSGFDTGIAIANTTTDPFGTNNQSGTCTLNFFGTAAPATPPTTANIPTGTVFTGLASGLAPGFQGYMIAVCNFQLAHGFAFISDAGARNLAMGYLALVLPTVTGNRNNITESLDH